MPFDMYSDVILTRDVAERGPRTAMSERSWSGTPYLVSLRKAIQSSFST